ncbi:MAG TPA: thiamine-phosphate kinase [Thermoanaerobaculia bacterium]|nr:thiamine-phosphate kinase [Thermoanaerobaculia bacterium]
MKRSASARGGEPALVEWLQRAADPGIGDDAAVLDLGGEWTVTVDAQHEGTHLPSGLDPALAARRLLAVNLSDVAAMGGRPRHAFLSLGAPAGYDRRRFLQGLIDGGARSGLLLSGGDNSRHPALSATLTVLASRPPRGRWLLRSSARPGDGLWVGGTLGEAALGLALLGHVVLPDRGLPVAPPLPASLRRAARRALRRHLQPEPQLELGLALGRRARVACIDCSDGLGLDLGRLCAASGVGAEVEVARLPTAHPALAARLQLDPVELALGSGEDYVLVFTLPSGAHPPAQAGVRRVGRIVEAPGVVAVGVGGERLDIARRGYDHLAGDG